LRLKATGSGGKISCFLPVNWRNHWPMLVTATLLKLTDVTKRYDAAGGAGGVNVLNAVALEVARGESLAIVGPSGSGKSTLLQIIGTLDRPSSGAVLLDGNDLGQLDDLQLAEVRNRQIGFVFQAHYLLPQCTVIENVLVPTLARSRRCEEADSTGRKDVRLVTSAATESLGARAERLLKRVGLGERLQHRPGQLSGGERQRVAVVRALINRPQLLLADEPTGALDHASATALGQLLVELNQEEGVTLIIVTHALDLAKRMGRVLRIEDGRLIPDGK
jgi:lipoprotein-releasing system ATP-binding protein